MIKHQIIKDINQFIFYPQKQINRKTFPEDFLWDIIRHGRSFVPRFYKRHSEGYFKRNFFIASIRTLYILMRCTNLVYIPLKYIWIRILYKNKDTFIFFLLRWVKYIKLYTLLLMREFHFVMIQYTHQCENIKLEGKYENKVV